MSALPSPSTSVNVIVVPGADTTLMEAAFSSEMALLITLTSSMTMGEYFLPSYSSMNTGVSTPLISTDSGRSNSPFHTLPSSVGSSSAVPSNSDSEPLAFPSRGTSAIVVSPASPVTATRIVTGDVSTPSPHSFAIFIFAFIRATSCAGPNTYVPSAARPPP